MVYAPLVQDGNLEPQALAAVSGAVEPLAAACGATLLSDNAADGETVTGLTAANACGSNAATHWRDNAADGETVRGADGG